MAPLSLSSERCSFVLLSKSRRCGQQRIPASEFCRHHAPAQCKDDREFSYCDLCKSYIRRQRFAKHPNKCPVVLREAAVHAKPYYVKSVNAGEDIGEALEEMEVVLSRLSMSEWSEEEKKLLLQRIDNFLNSRSSMFERTEFPEPETKLSEGERHREQHRRLLQRLRHHQLFSEPSNTVFVELGAGKAKLGLAVAEELHCDVVAVDMCTFHHSADAKFAKGKYRYKRVRINIEHLSLPHLPLLEGREMVGMSKHLCGCGAEFALKALAVNRPQAIFMGTCCHHRCTWRHFVGRLPMLAAGFSLRDFVLARKLTGWAVSGKGLSADSRRSGKLCKRFLDCCRAEFLSQQGFDVRLVEYISSGITPENVLIEAVPTRV